MKFELFFTWYKKLQLGKKKQVGTVLKRYICTIQVLVLALDIMSLDIVTQTKEHKSTSLLFIFKYNVVLYFVRADIKILNLYEG